jgi:TRAP-type mannitol/chloroaromatic compound transport system permease large subunit
MFCAAVPAAGAIGAKLNADQKKKLETGETKTEKPIAAITGGVIVLLVVGSVVYHTMLYS